MNNDYTHISILVDKSGSMAGSEQDIIGGINTFIEEQKKLPGKLTISFVQFDNLYEKMYDFVDIKDVVNLTRESYQPRGGTALLDATGRLMNETGIKLAAMPEAVRPSKVLFVVYTDGEENSSKEFSKATLDSFITKQKEVYSWDFVFLGANFTKVQAQQNYGNLFTASVGSASFAKGKSEGAYKMLSGKVGIYRSTQTKDDAIRTMNFTPEEEKSLA